MDEKNRSEIERAVATLRNQVLPNADSIISRIRFAESRLSTYIESNSIGNGDMILSEILNDLKLTIGSVVLIKDPIRNTSRNLEKITK